MEKFADRLRAMRKQRGKTQQDIADACYISFQSVGKWERGESVPSADKIILLAQALQVGVTQLVTGEASDNDGIPTGAFEVQKFGAFLVRLRERSHLTQAEVARQLYVTQPTVAKWESGALVPDLEQVVGLCACFGISPYGLFACRVDDGIEPEEPKIAYADTRKKRIKRMLVGVVAAVVILILAIAVPLGIRPRMYAVTLHNEFGDPTEQVFTVNRGDTYQPPQVSRDGYLFLGWNTQQDGCGTYYGTSFAIEQDTHCYAIWQAIWLDERTDGEHAAACNRAYLQLDGQLRNLTDFYREMALFFCAPYPMITIEQKLRETMSKSGCFDMLSGPRAFDLYACAIAQDLLDQARGWQASPVEITQLERLCVVLQDLSDQLNRQMYYDETGKWDEDYMQTVLREYTQLYRNAYAEVCAILQYADRADTPLDALERVRQTINPVGADGTSR